MIDRGLPETPQPEKSMFEIATKEQLVDIIEEIFHEGHVDVLEKYIEMKIHQEFEIIESAMSYPDGSKEKLQAAAAVNRVAGVKEFLRLVKSNQEQDEE